MHARSTRVRRFCCKIATRIDKMRGVASPKHPSVGDGTQFGRSRPTISEGYPPFLLKNIGVP
jgi:hypothetical protein